MDHSFFGGDSSGCGIVLNRLMRDGYVRARDGLPKRRRYYQLTRRGAEGRVSLDRTRPLRGQTLRGCLGILWFCCMMGCARHRLEKHELERVFDPPPTGPHCIERGSTNRIFRCRVVSTKTRADALMKALRIQIEAATSGPKMKAWLRSKNYSLAILAEQLRVRELERAVGRSGLRGFAHIIVVGVPSPQDLAKVISSWRKSS